MIAILYYWLLRNASYHEHEANLREQQRKKDKERFAAERRTPVRRYIRSESAVVVTPRTPAKVQAPTRTGVVRTEPQPTELSPDHS